MSSESIQRAAATRPDRVASREPETRALAIEGAFQSLGQGLGEAYLGAYALWLGAGGVALALVAALPNASGSLAQAAARRVRAGAAGARVFIMSSWAAQGAGYAALGLSLLLPRAASIAALCAVALVAWGCGGLATPAWTALVSSVVPRPRHGWFFGLRGAAQQAGALAAIVGGAAILSAMTERGLEGGGFALIFLVAAAARLAGAALIHGVETPAAAPRPRARVPAMTRGSVKFRRLALYLWMLHFATYISTPFFVPYMLRDLRFSYALVGLLVAVPAVIKIATLRLWGRLADRIGPGPLLRGTGWLVVVVPGLWLVSGSPWWILAAQAYSGLAWGAFELAQASAILQATRGREREVALFNTVDGVVILGGSLAGGAAVNLFASPAVSGFLGAMALSTLLRAVPAVALLWRVRGIGRPAVSHLALPLRILSVRPTRGVSIQFWGGLPAAGRPGSAPEASLPEPAGLVAAPPDPRGT